MELFVLLLIMGAFWIVFGWTGPTPQAPPPVTREQVVAKVMLHETRGRRELDELIRDINDSADQRLSELHRDDWLER